MIRELFRSLPVRLVQAAGLFLVGWVAASAASAHEMRDVGPKGEYTLVVGWFIEPAFTGVVNAVDISVDRTADHKAISTNKGDVVDLEVEVQYRSAEDEKSEVVTSMKLANKPSITFGSNNRYASWFKPVRAGAYAFRIKGKISDASDPKAGAVTIDETFVCGKGSKGPHGFVCLQEPQVFPATPSPAAKTH
jgi:hypothetical protein